MYLVDVAPFERATDPLLYEWDELEQLADAAEAYDAAAAAQGVQLSLTAASPTQVALVLTPLAAAAREPPPAPELRLVPAHGVAPSAQMYYGWPQELRQAGGSEHVEQLLEAARAAAGQG